MPFAGRPNVAGVRPGAGGGHSLILNGLPGQDDEAHQLVDRILAAPGGGDPAEEARIKERARQWKSKH